MSGSTDRRLAALTAICDTFAPGGDGLPSASSIGTPTRVAATIDALPRAADRRQLRALLALWDTRALTAVGCGGPRRFSTLPQAERERVLRSWADSRSVQRRTAFHALRRLALATYVSMADTARPVWDAIGYPGPIGAIDAPAPLGLEPLAVTGDVVLDCDVVVVGSGAGGGPAAAALAAAGLDVVVVEMGEALRDAELDGGEERGLARGYLEAGAAQTRDGLVALLAGRCLGGGTMINYTTSFATPADVRAEWAAHGVPAFAGEVFTDSLERVSRRLGVGTGECEPSSRDRIMRRGLEALGWHVATMPRNVRGCDQGRSCGYCSYGCRLGAKQSTVKTFLPDAAARGARIVVRTRIERITTATGSATGVEGRTVDGHAVRIRSRAVVVACGALHTPVLLRRSGIVNPNVGRHLHVHPVTALFGLFDEVVEPWTGSMQALYSDQHRDLGGGYGLKYETASVHPSLLAALLPWRDAASHREVLRRLPNLSPIGILLRDRGAGEVRVTREGEPDVRYRLADDDRRNMQVGVDGAASILEAAGARWVGSVHASGPSYEPGRRGSRRSFTAAVATCGYDAGRVSLVGFHLMGTARMGGTAATAAVGPEGESFDVRGVVVCDGSAFPTASGVNPMLSIAAIGDMNARALAARLA
jgi:choline dehydrogenase-like flavoprotein